MEIDPLDLEVSTFPLMQVGGMSTGTSYSGIRLYHVPTAVGVLCHTERSQHANKEKALTMLEILLELEGWEARR